MRPQRWTAWLTLPLLFVLAPSRTGAETVSTATILPSSPTTLDRVQITLTGYRSCALAFDPAARVSASSIRIDAKVSTPCPASPPSFWLQRFLVGPLAAGTYTLAVYIDQDLAWSSQFTVTTDTRPTEIFLGQGRFRVNVDWRDPRAGAGPGFARPLTDESGYFWFFSPSGVELTVKVLDGRPINGHFWVFVASMTDVGFTLVVTDTADQLNCPATAPTVCPSRTYVNPASRNQNFIDVTAF
jgi:hypothetical protein